MAKFDSVGHPDKIPATLEKDDRIRNMYMSYLLVEDDDKLISFNDFSDAVLLSVKDEMFCKRAHIFTAQKDASLTTSPERTIEEQRNFFREILKYRKCMS